MYIIDRLIYYEPEALQLESLPLQLVLQNKSLIYVQLIQRVLVYAVPLTKWSLKMSDRLKTVLDIDSKT